MLPSMFTVHPVLQAKWEALGETADERLFAKAKTTAVPFWWHGPTPANRRVYNNGTLSLVDTGERIVGVTAWHVFWKYQQRLDKGRPFVCQFGAVTVRPERLLIDRSERLDLATFDLTSIISELRDLTAHRPSVWPPCKPVKHDLVVFGGYPGAQRRAHIDRVDLGGRGGSVYACYRSRAGNSRQSSPSRRTAN
jgi:hypothetical protein